MNTLLRQLKSDTSFFEESNVTFYNFSLKQDITKLEKLIQEKSPNIFNQYHIQVKDLIENRNPSEKLSEDKLNSLIDSYIKDNPGTWVYYPWNKNLVHILNEKDFIEVRTVRNKYKITQKEQDLLATKKVGVIGLSVGQSVSLSLAMERAFGELRIADYDTLELSNINRIRTPISNLNLKKTIIVKREISEIDPYLNIKTYPKGLEQNKIEDFIKGLDIIVDEFDDFYLKIELRKAARKLKIPVISEMSDRGMIDLERYDLEPERTIFHGRISSEELKTYKKLNLPDLIEKIIPFDSISDRMKQSYIQLGKTLRSWPQLGADVTYGGAVCTILIKKILLDENINSGRYYFDIDKFILLHKVIQDL